MLTVTDIISGCSATDTLTITALILPQITLGNDTALCTGDSVQLIAGGGIAYSWIPSTGLSADSIPNPWAGPADTTIYYVIVTDSNGCSDTDSIIIFIYPLPNAGEDTSICLGDSAQLSASGGMSYSWSPATSLGSDTIQNPWASPTDTTTYYVTVIDSNGCIGVDSVTITVEPLIIAGISGDSVICNGEALTLIAIGSGNYSWSTGDTTQSITVSPSNNTTYLVTVTDTCGSSIDSIIVVVLVQNRL